MMEGTRHAGNLKLVGGNLALDFANTVDWHASDRPQEYLHRYGDLLAWARHAGALSETEADRLATVAARRPDDARAALDRSIAVREAIYRIFSAVAAGREPEAGDLATLNAALGRALAHAVVVSEADGFAWGWGGDEDTLDRALWPVVRAAAELLTSAQIDRVRECADGRCGWLFIDTSRNRSRRWCDMSDCGNRAKARRHYRRSRSIGTRET